MRRIEEALNDSKLPAPGLTLDLAQGSAFGYPWECVRAKGTGLEMS